MSRIVAVAPKQGHFWKKQDDMAAKAAEAGDEITFIFRDKGSLKNVMADIRNASPDILITEDLEGFEMCTLTDAVSYNLIHCRQFHFLFSDHPENEKYLAKQLSLVMTFVCMDAANSDRISEMYPDLPEVTLMDDISDMPGFLCIRQ